jgi:uncharacterized metal-binding protein YceD (DUF177 family)
VTPEFSRIVDLARLPAHETIEASAEERAALARRLGLPRLDRLVAEVRLARLADEAVRLEARLEAEVVQECVVTLEPVPARLAEDFVIVYAAHVDEAAVVEVADDAVDVEPLEGGSLDIGEAVAQQLALTLDPYPHAPGAALPDAALTGDDAAPHPFAALARLKPAGRRA